jgi:hypothetical protein
MNAEAIHVDLAGILFFSKVFCVRMSHISQDTKNTSSTLIILYLSSG